MLSVGANTNDYWTNQLPWKNCRTWERGLHLLVQYMKLYGDPRNFVSRCLGRDLECQLIISRTNWKSRWVLFYFVFLTLNIPSQTTTPTYSHTYTACLCLLGIYFIPITNTDSTTHIAMNLSKCTKYFTLKHFEKPSVSRLFS